MLSFKRYILLSTFLFIYIALSAQTTVKGKIIDAASKEPIVGATINCTMEGCRCGCTTNDSGEFELNCNDCQYLSVSSIGYAAQKIPVAAKTYLVSLNAASLELQQVVLTANRGEGTKRSEAPIAISSISSKVLQDAKPATADQVLNKISGVNVVNLGNEQHQMSIRQPMTTKSLFLYLEDGIPVRTSGLYNHNALLEMNLAATRSIEVIKGPSSSLYGSEAIGGVVNFITLSPSSSPVLRISTQANDAGYRRADFVGSVTEGKWGFLLSGYHAKKANGFMEHTDFNKSIITGKIDYRFSDKTTLSNSLTWLNYSSDMAGGVDSTMFANRTFQSQQTFTYRKVNAVRYRSTLTHNWNDDSKSTINILYRNNSIRQNPAYRIKDDYRKRGNVYAGDKELAHGEINENSFNSYAVVAQHRQNFHWKRAAFVGGLNADLSPSGYEANYIRIKKDTVSGKYTSYNSTDSSLSDYSTKLNNYAAFANFEFSPLEKMRVVASLRYDYFYYGFRNHLPATAFSGSADMSNHFSRLSPKVGFTYNISNNTGVYANYSEGFVPPQVTELYTGVKVPDLKPSVFYNYEIGGWVQVVKNKLFADVSLYKLDGTHEIISVKQDDGSFLNKNAGKTMHRGVEFGVTSNPFKDVSIRVSGAYSNHEFVEFEEKGVSFDGNVMNNAPAWINNAEVWYKPSFVAGLRIGAEWQHVGSYFVDPQNSEKYAGYDCLNVRVGYRLNNFEVWLNVLNATDNYYSYITSKSSFGYSYQVAEPRNFNVGVAYDFGKLFKKDKKDR